MRGLQPFGDINNHAETIGIRDTENIRYTITDKGLQKAKLQWDGL